MKKTFITSTLFALAVLCAAMDVATFNKGTEARNWTNDFPLANKGTFEMEEGVLKLTLTGRGQCVRQKCSIEGLPANKLMYFSFYCEGKDIVSPKEGFRAYLATPLPKQTSAFSPAGSWKWAKGTFGKVLVEGRFKVPSDGKLDVKFELRGDGGELKIYSPMITPVKRKDALDKSPVKISVLPAEWLKNTTSLVQNMPVMVKVNFRADGKKFAGKDLDFVVEHPGFVELIGVEYKRPVTTNGRLHYPALATVKKKGSSVVFRLPEAMVKLLKRDSVDWNNELYVFFNTASPAGKTGRAVFSLREGKKELVKYAFDIRTCGPLPADRRAARNFKTVIGYPVTAESPFPEVRSGYAAFWKSLTRCNEAYSPVWFDRLAEELQRDFRKNYTAGHMIGGTNSIPLFRVMKLDGKYPHLKDVAGNVMKMGRTPLPSIKYVIDDPDNLIWEKTLKEEIKYRSLALPDVKFICFDYEPYLTRAGRCEDNLKWFAEWAKLASVPSSKDVSYKYAAKWAQFRRYQTELLFQRFAAAVKKHFPELEFRYCSDPLSAAGEPSSWCANDPRLSVKQIEVFHNMPYIGGSDFFDVIRTNTEILGKKQYPIIDPSEFAEQFFRKYSPLKTAQNIVAAAALNNIGIGFWHKECFDGTYLIGIARAFAAVAEAEDLYGRENATADFRVTAENCLKKNIGGNSLLEYPETTKKIRFTAHKKGAAAVVTVFNYDSGRKVIVKCAFPELKPGTYAVRDVFGGGNCGSFSAAELREGILAQIAPDSVAVLKAVPASAGTPADVSQADLRREVEKTLSALAKEQSFEDVAEGNCRISWVVPQGGKGTALMLSCGQMKAAVDPETGDIVSIPGTPVRRFGDVILENSGLGNPLKYTRIFTGIKDGRAVAAFQADVRKEDSTDPHGFRLDGLRIVKTYTVSGKDVKSTLRFENLNRAGETLSLRARLRSMLGPVKVKEVPAGLDAEILLKQGEKIDLPWAARPRKTPWEGKAVTFADRMIYRFDGGFAGVYFWQSASLITAEPFTPVMTLRPGDKREYPVVIETLR
ncbi:MAG: hypothetical protein IJU70_12115 [Lentisphaeria bacterium]|nr:hypothetical protein [Lentisphaeria bacterium]